VRDAAIISILYACGLRRAELVKLDLADYDVSANTFKVKGKGNKERLGHLPAGAAAALGDWLMIRGDDPGPLFLAIRKGGHTWPGRLTTQAVYHILQTRAGLAGVKDFSPHDFRRTFVGDLLDAGADISTVQKMAGHASVSTTQRYDRRPEAAKRKAADLLHVPYQPRVLRAR
jgi:site-specific recombinase XerD